MANQKNSKIESNDKSQLKTRLDKWLWAARYYKTRQLAAEAINGGHVHLNGQRIKPSRVIQVADQLTINKTPFTFEITVEALSIRRGPAKEAQQLYSESEESIQKRETLAEQRKLNAAQFPHAERRPDKRNRRRIIRFKNINRES
ncbi:MAG: ribosome-associated heat shock protein Hsp15 [Gammaproteobacteria bacterium]|nr:ribosome-associated heat shock protein Hsp15 [Gammaproteobacteria bacterium]MDH5659581.1 ribosome-associated heat shock protein Hsp15 [Gammaproteobacteria bacterium]